MSSRGDWQSFPHHNVLKIPAACVDAIAFLRCRSRLALLRRGEMPRANLSSHRRRIAARKKDRPGAERTQNEGTVFSAPGRKAWQRDGKAAAESRQWRRSRAGKQCSPRRVALHSRATQLHRRGGHKCRLAQRITFASCGGRELTGAQREEDLVGKPLQFGDAVAVGQQGDRHPRARALLAHDGIVGRVARHRS